MNVGVKLLFSQCKTFIVDKKKKKISHLYIISILANDTVEFQLLKHKVEQSLKKKKKKPVS